MNRKKVPRGRPFQKGKSGNPTGRPSNKVFKEFLSEVVDEKTGVTRRDSVRLALYLKAINARDRDQYRAIELICAYDIGKPVQGVELSGPGGGPVQTHATENMTSGERRKRIQELLALAAGRAVPAAPSTAANAGDASDE